VQSTKTIEGLSVHITNHLCFSVSASARAQSKCSNAQKVYADLAPTFHFDAYPEPAFHFDAYPEPAFHFDAYPEPAFHFVADPDPDLTFTLMQIRIRKSSTSGL
jgi:hypothetical protein